MSIESDLKQIIEGFIHSSAGLFEITGQFSSTFEQGVYACAIARPTKRLRAALGLNREILVVASSFTDQQQRSIKFVKREIESSAGRFESTIAIFVHNDKDGNEKLKNWGRTQGLSILPLYRPSLTNNPTDLERSLCAELYSHDPYDVTGPVSDDTNFFGRRDEAIDLARKLQRNQIRSCLGIRKIGKTSIINRVVQEITTNHRCICVMVDCSRDDVWSSSAPSLLAAIGASVSAAVESDDTYASVRTGEYAGTLVNAREALESAILRSSLPIIIIFDEIDYITPGSPTGAHWKTEFNSFWRNFRAIYQEVSRRTKNFSVLVGGVSTYWFTVESVDGVENAALSFVPDEYLSPMPQGATIAMLKRLSKAAGLRFDEATYELIARTSGNMPFWARKCCSSIHNQIPVSDRPKDVSTELARPIIEAFAQDEGAAIAAVALKHLFRVHPGLESAASSCANGQASAVGKSTLRVLAKYGVTDHDNAVSATMVLNGLRSITQYVKEETNELSAGQVGALDEWAEDIAAISKRRNILERKMRDLVLNWIRHDSAKSSAAASTKERVLAVVPSTKRAGYDHLAADSLIEKLLWTELAQLIEREWALFERVFGDKGKFAADCSIINDRFDAHAKNADKADFALYRRSLSQLEERINRL